MLEKLKKVEEKFEFISAELCKSEVVSDMELYKKYMQELKHLSPIVEKYREHKAALQNAEEAKALLDESGADAELKELARAELEEAKENIERTRQELKVMLLPRDPNDDRNVIVEIRGGAGGVSDSAGGETVSDPVPLFGGEGGAYRAGAPGSRTVSQYGHASGRRQRRGAGDADRRGGLRDVPSHGHAGGKQYCVTEGVSRRWGRQWPFPFSAGVLPAAETKKHP